MLICVYGEYWFDRGYGWSCFNVMGDEVFC